MEEILKQIVIRLDAMEKGIKLMESRAQINHEENQGEFGSINEKLDRIERKIGNIPPTYEEFEKILDRHGLDIELIKKLILNQ